MMPAAIDLLEQLCVFDPRVGRLSAENALEHRYVQQFHDTAAETTAHQNVTLEVDDYDKKSTSFYRQELYQLANRWPTGAGGRSQRFGGF